MIFNQIFNHVLTLTTMDSYFTENRAECLFLENVWRQNINKAQFISTYRIFNRIFPKDIILTIIEYNYIPNVIDMRRIGNCIKFESI